MTNQSNTATVRAAGTFRNVIGIIAVGACIVAGFSCWDDFTSNNATVTIQYLILGLGLYLLNVLISSYAWYQLMASLGSPIQLMTALRSWSYSQVVNYIPGKIPVLYMRIDICRVDGALPGIISTGTVIEILLCLASTLSIWLISSLFSPPRTLVPTTGYIALLVLMLMPLHPKVLTWCLNRYYKWRGITWNPNENRIHFCSLMRSGALYLMAWILYGMGGFFILMSVAPEIPHTKAAAVSVAGSFAFAWAVGYLAFLTPGGLGVREAAIVLMLSVWSPLEMLVIAALLSRLCQVGINLTFAMVSWIIYYLKLIDNHASCKTEEEL